MTARPLRGRAPVEPHLIRMEPDLWDALVREGERLTKKEGKRVTASEAARRILESALKPKTKRRTK